MAFCCLDCAYEEKEKKTCTRVREEDNKKKGTYLKKREVEESMMQLLHACSSCSLPRRLSILHKNQWRMKRTELKIMHRVILYNWCGRQASVPRILCGSAYTTYLYTSTPIFVQWSLRKLYNDLATWKIIKDRLTASGPKNLLFRWWQYFFSKNMHFICFQVGNLHQTTRLDRYFQGMIFFGRGPNRIFSFSVHDKK